MKNTKKCVTCGKFFEKRLDCSQSNWERQKNCSRLCVAKSLVKQNTGVCSNTGRTHFKKGISGSPTTQFKKGQVSFWKGKPNPHFAGANNPRWKGGIYLEHLKERHSDRMKEFTKKILKRDNYTCQDCGRKRKPGDRVILCAHHKKSFAIHKELRFKMNNAITLCEECHKKTNSYGVNL